MIIKSVSIFLKHPFKPPFKRFMFVFSRPGIPFNDMLYSCARFRSKEVSTYCVEKMSLIYLFEMKNHIDAM